MRKFIIPLLLASVAASPAIAGPRDDSNHPAKADRAERQQVREERQQARQERQQVRQDRPQFSGERPQVNGQGRFSGGMNDGQPQLPRPDRANVPQQGFAGGGSGEVNVDRPRGRFQGNGGPYVAPGPRAVQNPFAGGGDRELRRERREQALEGRVQRGDVRPRVVDNDQLRRSDRPLPRVLRSRVPVVSDTPRPGTQPPLRTENRRHGSGNWSTNWRNDRRYDWHDWRRRHRSHFHLSFYYDPFGWGYSPFSVGWRMWPSYYGSRYWINDPYQYRLPYAPPGYRWVRYYDDAVLVDTWSGEVVDVIYNFFW
jgi:Ni/Co efflux regulator RcnB